MMNPPEKPKVTCYSAGEGEFMQTSQALRGYLLQPVLRVLEQMRITPNQLTLLSLLTGLAFSPVFLMGCPLTAFSLLVLHVLLDGLDGPLARFTGRASNQGSFSDTVSDQVVVTFSTLTMIHAGHASAWPGGLYVFFYCVVVLFAMVRSALSVPYSWLFRPRFLVFLWFPVELYLWPGSLNWALWAMSALLALKMITGFVQIRRRM